MTKIQPVQVPTKGIATSIDILILSFKLNSESCSSYYKLVSDDNVILIEGNLEIPSNIFLNWGVDDQIVFDYILTSLNLSLLVE